MVAAGVRTSGSVRTTITRGRSKADAAARASSNYWGSVTGAASAPSDRG